MRTLYYCPNCKNLSLEFDIKLKGFLCSMCGFFEDADVDKENGREMDYVG